MVSKYTGCLRGELLKGCDIRRIIIKYKPFLKLAWPLLDLVPQYMKDPIHNQNGPLSGQYFWWRVSADSILGNYFLRVASDYFLNDFQSICYSQLPTAAWSNYINILIGYSNFRRETVVSSRHNSFLLIEAVPLVFSILHQNFTP
jgi:hypothetical protein